VRQACHLLTGMLHATVKDARLPRNPAIGVDRPRLRPVRRRSLRHEQRQAPAVARGPVPRPRADDGLLRSPGGEGSSLRVQLRRPQARRLHVPEKRRDGVSS